MEIRKQVGSRLSMSLVLMAGLAVEGCVCTESPEGTSASAQQQATGPQPKSRREAQQRRSPDPTVSRAKRTAPPQTWQVVGRGSWLAGPPLGADVTPLDQVVNEPGSFTGKKVRVRGQGQRCGGSLLVGSGAKLLLVQPPLPVAGELGRQVDAEGEVSTEAGLKTARSECAEAGRAVALLIASSVMIGSGSR